MANTYSFGFKLKFLGTLFIAGCVLLIPKAEAGFLDQLKETISAKTQMPSDSAQVPADATIISGLKEALSIGIKKAVENAGVEDGFYKNPEIKIPFPEKLMLIDKTLRKVGLGSQIDTFELSMNRAAEKAAPYAKEIVLDALKQMTFSDAKKIISGSQTAATDYFKTATSDKLTAVFKQQAQAVMNEYTITQQYNGLVHKYNELPLAAKPKLFDAEDYVAAKTIDGLFKLMGDEEQKIRQDPKARVTELLKTVFGSNQNG
ncbi:MAG: DUF4197 domain-containing protein [Candidatus Omnitrophica bacterium]|nr:DUF4197 domain-containing protein [Candidatus Omnitrophota bacterium]